VVTATNKENNRPSSSAEAANVTASLVGSLQEALLPSSAPNAVSTTLLSPEERPSRCTIHLICLPCHLKHTLIRRVPTMAHRRIARALDALVKVGSSPSKERSTTASPDAACSSLYSSRALQVSLSAVTSETVCRPWERSVTQPELGHPSL